MTHQEQSRHARARRRSLTPWIVAGLVVLALLIALIVHLATRGTNQATPEPITPVAVETTPTSVPAPEATTTHSEVAETTTAAPETPEVTEAAPTLEQELLEPGELPVSVLPPIVGDYQLSDISGLYTYAKPDTPPGSGVSVTDVGDEFYPEELLMSLPGATEVAGARGVCGDGDLPLCYVGLTDYGAIMLNALDSGTPRADVEALADAIVAHVG